jgi:hypothetical protein
LVLLARTGWPAPPPEELFAQASASFEAGDPAAASGRLELFRSTYADHRLYWPASLLWALSLVNGTHYGLAATVYVYMFDGKVLLPFAAMFFQCFHLRRECPQ